MAGGSGGGGFGLLELALLLGVPAIIRKNYAKKKGVPFWSFLKMATKVAMKHKDTGIMKDGYYGFSWTTFFFGFFPALFRGDYKTFLGGFAVSLILGLATFGVAWLIIGIIWAFMYNKFYTRNLLGQGYVFYADSEINAAAAEAVGVDLSTKAYQKATSEGTNKTCPYCAETIKVEAVICRFCSRDQQITEREIAS